MINQKEIAVLNHWNFIILKPTHTHSNQQAGSSSTKGAGLWWFRTHVSYIYIPCLLGSFFFIILSSFAFFSNIFSVSASVTSFLLGAIVLLYVSCDSLLSSDKRVGKLRFYDASYISKNKIFSIAHMVAKHIESSNVNTRL